MSAAEHGGHETNAVLKSATEHASPKIEDAAPIPESVYPPAPAIVSPRGKRPGREPRVVSNGF